LLVLILHVGGGWRGGVLLGAIMHLGWVRMYAQFAEYALRNDFLCSFHNDSVSLGGWLLRNFVNGDEYGTR
jgi:hypothetical protein